MMRTIAVLAALLLTASAASAAVDLNAAAVGAGPYYLNQAGASYRLVEDIAVPGTAFVFAANNVTLDLNGHTVTFGTAAGRHRYGIAVPPPYAHTNAVWSQSDIRVWAGATGAVMKNGRVVQGAARADSCNAVSVYGQNSITISGLDILIYGPDTFAIHCEEGRDFLIYNNTITDSTNVVTNRHQGRAAIDLLAMADGPIEVFNNTVVNCRQWGIRVGRRRPVTVWGHIYNNHVYPNTIVSNGYGIEVYSDLMEVYGNTIRATNGRGIHLDGCMSPRIHDNDIEVMEQPVSDEYNRVSAHGIKIEGCNDADIHHNTVVSNGVVNSRDHESLGAGLSLSLGANTFNWVHDNHFIGRHLGGAQFDPANYGSYATPIELYEVEPTGRILIENNTLSSNDRMFAVLAWFGVNGQPADGRDIVLRGNTFLRDTGGSPTGRPEMLAIGSSFTNLVFQDCTIGSGIDLRRFTSGWPWTFCSWGVGWSGTARVVDSGGTAMAGVTVNAIDGAGATVTSAVTDGAGNAILALPAYSVSTSGEPYEDLDRVTEHNPYVLRATVNGTTVQATATPSAPGGSWTLTADGGTVDPPPPPPPATPPGVGDLGWAFQVLTTSPQGGPAPVGAELRWMFNEPVSLGTLNSGTVVVVGSTSGAVTGQIDLGLNGRLVVFRPASSLTAGETITARLSGVIRSSSGHYLDGNRDGLSEATDADAFTLVFAVSE
jgi:hypothetical protein